MFLRSRWFLIGFVTTLLLFTLLNIVAAHLRSDCGIRAVIGLWLHSWSPCNDDIVRIGFPFLVLEEGGFAYRFNLYPLAALLNNAIGIGTSLLVGILLQRYLGTSRFK